jgi:hypothetical protein
MMKNLGWAIVLFVAVTSSAAGGPECRAPTPTFDVSFPSTDVPPAERIVGFELTVTGADVVAITRIPKGWSVKLDADQPSRKVSGTIHQGVDAVAAASELPIFAMARPGAGDRHDALELDGVVYTSADLKTYVRHRIGCSELMKRGSSG